MTTARQMIDSAAREAGIVATGQTLESDQESDILKRLNMMLSSWKNDGVDMGLSTPLALGDTLYVDESDEEAIMYKLAIKVMNKFRRQVPQDTFLAAKDAYRSLQSKYFNPKFSEIELPLQKGIAIDNDLS